MNRITRIVAGTTLAAVVGLSIAACGSSQPDSDVLQYGYYTSAHVYVAYPTPHVVHISYKVYHSDSRMYSTPAYEKTYVKDPHHTVVRTTTTKTTKH